MVSPELPTYGVPGTPGRLDRQPEDRGRVRSRQVLDQGPATDLQTLETNDVIGRLLDEQLPGHCRQVAAGFRDELPGITLREGLKVPHEVKPGELRSRREPNDSAKISDPGFRLEVERGCHGQPTSTMGREWHRTRKLE